MNENTHTFHSGKILCDTILYNGTIYTQAHKPPCQAIAIQAGKIVGTGTTVEIQMHFAGKETIPMTGKFIYPGFADSHLHLLGIGFALLQANLIQTQSICEILSILAKQSPYQGWIRGYGWDQNLFNTHQFPLAQDLDSTFPNIPAFLLRIDGHAAWVNSVALQYAHITSDTPDPMGGKILRDIHGAPTGILIDNAMELVRSLIPTPDREMQERALTLAVRKCLQYGITSIHDAGIDWSVIELYKDFCDHQALLIRVYAMIDGMNENNLSSEFLKNIVQRPRRYGKDHLHVSSVKIYSDGALGSRGAALLEAYSDDSNNIGIALLPFDNLCNRIYHIAQLGLQPCIHAIGDRANHEVLNAFKQALTPQQRKLLRPRIEHAQILHPDDIQKFARLGVIASMQPSHAVSDMPWAKLRIGEKRLKTSYAWKSLLQSGCVLVGGSDAPIESVNPMIGFHAATCSGYPEQLLTRQEALAIFTENSAFSVFAEEYLGRLDVGKWADFTVLDRDIMTVPEGEILATKVQATYVAGQMQYANDIV